MLLGRLLKIDSTFPDSGFPIQDSGLWFPGFRFALVTSSPASRVTRLLCVLSPVTPKKICTMGYQIPHYSQILAYTGKILVMASARIIHVIFAVFCMTDSLSFFPFTTILAGFYFSNHPALLPLRSKCSYPYL